MFPEIRIEPPEPLPVCNCEWCGKDIYAGDTAYRISGLIVCHACIEDERFEVEEPEPPECD